MPQPYRSRRISRRDEPDGEPPPLIHLPGNCPLRVIRDRFNRRCACNFFRSNPKADMQSSRSATRAAETSRPDQPSPVGTTAAAPSSSTTCTSSGSGRAEQHFGRQPQDGAATLPILVTIAAAMKGDGHTHGFLDVGFLLGRSDYVSHPSPGRRSSSDLRRLEAAPARGRARVSQ